LVDALHEDKQEWYPGRHFTDNEIEQATRHLIVILEEEWDVVIFCGMQLPRVVHNLLILNALTVPHAIIEHPSRIMNPTQTKKVLQAATGNPYALESLNNDCTLLNALESHKSAAELYEIVTQDLNSPWRSYSTSKSFRMELTKRYINTTPLCTATIGRSAKWSLNADGRGLKQKLEHIFYAEDDDDDEDVDDDDEDVDNDVNEVIAQMLKCNIKSAEKKEKKG